MDGKAVGPLRASISVCPLLGALGAVNGGTEKHAAHILDHCRPGRPVAATIRWEPQAMGLTKWNGADFYPAGGTWWVCR